MLGIIVLVVLRWRSIPVVATVVVVVGAIVSTATGRSLILLLWRECLCIVPRPLLAIVSIVVVVVVIVVSTATTKVPVIIILLVVLLVVVTVTIPPSWSVVLSSWTVLMLLPERDTHKNKENK